MQYNNTYAPNTSIARPSSLNPGGVCGIIFFLWEDVAQWPAINPATGIIADSVVLRAGKSFYTMHSIDTDRYFKEEIKYGNGGPYHDITVNCKTGGNHNTATLALGKYQHHQFGLLVKDRNGEQRLVGDKYTGAKIFFDYTSGDFNDARSRTIKWEWQNSQPAPIYHDGGITGTLPPICAQYSLIARFRVGAIGAPMVDGETTYTNPALVNSNFLLFADGVAVIQLTDNPGQRYCTKPYASNTITFNGGVYGPPTIPEGEVIEIYKVV